MTVLFTSKKRSFGFSSLFDRKTKSCKRREGIDCVTVSPLIKHLLPAQESQAHVTSVLCHITSGGCVPPPGGIPVNSWWWRDARFSKS